MGGGKPMHRSFAERQLYNRKNATERNANTTIVLTLEPPDRIKDNPDKLVVWNYLCNDLAARQLLSTSYFVQLTVLCDNIVEYDSLLKTYEESGPLIPLFGKDGESIVGYRQNPLFHMIKSVEKSILKGCEKFGLNPKDAVYTSNPDIKARLTTPAEDNGKKKITYFAS